jgi:protein phosphatase
MRVRAVGLSDVGLSRAHNEDCFQIGAERNVYIVADGMGGHSHGEVASRIAVDAIVEFVERSADGDITWPFGYDSKLDLHANRLKAAIQIAHDRVLHAIEGDDSLAGMGTTVVGMLLNGQHAAIAHVGDSRAYRLRENKLELLTQDHTWVNEQVVAGFLSEEQARAHPLKNVVTRALGGETEVIVDVKQMDLKPGDVYLLCSDGLTTMLGDEEIEERLKAGKSPEETCRRLVRDANSRGGLDNITVVMLRVENDAA